MNYVSLTSTKWVGPGTCSLVFGCVTRQEGQCRNEKGCDSDTKGVGHIYTCSMCLLMHSCITFSFLKCITRD